MHITKFWKQVEKCQHVWNPNYYESYTCANEYCEAHEEHCLKCGVYKTECKCGFENGMSGHPIKRSTRKKLKAGFNIKF